MAIRKIVSRSIGTDVIAAEDLAANSVTVAEITDGAVTSAKMNGLTGSSSGIIQADGDGSLSTTTADLVDDTTPQLGGDLDLNSNNITGSGNIIISGVQEFGGAIDETSEYNAQLKIDGETKTAGKEARILFQHDDHGSASIGAEYQSSGYADLVFKTRGGGNPAEQMRIHAEGPIVMPNRPCFQVYNNNASDFDISTPSKPFLITCFTGENFDVGSNYDTSAHKFTAPVGGVYLFGMHARLGAPGSIRVVRVGIYKNNSYQSDLASAGGGNNYDGGSGYDHPPLVGTQMLQLSANDEITLKIENELSSSDTLYIQTGTRSHWWGMLVT